jgi:hypothetical protein
MRVWSLVILGLLVGCGDVVGAGEGKVDASLSDGRGGGGGHGGAGGDGSTSGDGQSSGGDSGGSCSNLNVPQYHRPTAVSCPTARAPGDVIPPDASPPPGCHDDSDCTMGKNGRCLAISSLGPCVFDAGCTCGFDGCTSTGCSYDVCYSDSECSNVPCACRPLASSNAPNVCAVGSNCRIDSDCGPCGYCSPSGEGYFCHTVQDTCTNNSDCPSSGCPEGCEFDPNVKHWSCVAQCPP